MQSLDTLPPSVQFGVVFVGLLLLAILLRGALGRALQQGLERVQEICALLLQKALHPEQLLRRGKEAKKASGNAADAQEDGGESPATNDRSVNESTGSEVFMIVTRLLGLVFTLDILLALLILDGIRTGLVVFQDESSAGFITLPVSIPTVMGLLGWSLIVLMGSLLLEVVMPRMPAGFEFLLPGWREARASRILFSSLIGAGSVVMFCYVVLLGVVAQLQLNHISWPAAGVLVAALQMVLANLVGMFSLWVLVLGLGAVFALACLVVRLLCALLLMLLKAWVQAPKEVTWNPRETPPVAPENAGQSVYRVGKLAPYQTTLVLIGDFGRRILLKLAPAVSLLRGRNLLRQVAYCPTERTPDKAELDAIRETGARNSSNSPREFAIAQEQGRDKTAYLLEQVRQKIQQHHPRVTGDELLPVGLEYELVSSAGDPLSSLKAAVPRQFIFPMVEMPATVLQLPEGQAVVQELADRWNNKKFACTLLIDRQATDAQRRGRDYQIRMLAHCLSGLMLGHLHSLDNPTGVKFLTQLGRNYPFVMLAVDTIALSPGEPRAHLTHGATRGMGSVEETRGSLIAVAERLLTDETARLFPAALVPQPGRLAAEVFVPFEKQDRRFRDVCEGLEDWTAQYAPGAQLMFIAGPGAKDSSPDNHYRAQWSWWYGVSLDELLKQREEPPQQLQVQLPQRKSSSITPRARTASASSAAMGSQSATGRKRGRRTPLRVVTDGTNGTDIDEA